MNKIFLLMLIVLTAIDITEKNESTCPRQRVQRRNHFHEQLPCTRLVIPIERRRRWPQLCTMGMPSVVPHEARRRCLAIYCNSQSE